MQLQTNSGSCFSHHYELRFSDKKMSDTLWSVIPCRDTEGVIRTTLSDPCRTNLAFHTGYMWREVVLPAMHTNCKEYKVSRILNMLYRQKGIDGALLVIIKCFQTGAEEDVTAIWKKCL